MKSQMGIYPRVDRLVRFQIHGRAVTFQHGQRHRAQTAAQRAGKLRREGQRGKRRGAAAGGQRVSVEAAIGAEYLPHEREEPDAPDNGQHGQRKQADAEYRAADAARPELYHSFLFHYFISTFSPLR